MTRLLLVMLLAVTAACRAESPAAAPETKNASPRWTRCAICVVLRKKLRVRKVKTTKEEVGRYDHVYDSAAAYGGTIFWKFNADDLKISRGKEYK
jgi:hypothetical protein